MFNMKARNLLILSTLALTVAACGSSGTASKSPPTSSGGSAGGVTYQSLWGSREVGSQFVTPVTSGDSFKIDVGGGYTITWKKGTKLKIAFLDDGSSNSFLAARDKGVISQAAKYGLSVTHLSSNFSAQTNLAQIQQAVNSGQFNALIAQPDDPGVVCDVMSKVAPSKNILVLNINSSICGKQDAPGDAQWQPGTLSMVGGTTGITYWEAWMNRIISENPNATSIAFLDGPKGEVAADVASEGVTKVLSAHPQIKLLPYATDFSTAQGLSVTRDLLNAHPDVSVIASVYSGITQGTVTAVREAGKTSKVKVYSSGSGASDIALIQSGAVTMSGAQYPALAGVAAVDALISATQGIKTPRYVGGDGAPTPNGGGSFTFLNKDNIAGVVPEY